MLRVSTKGRYGIRALLDLALLHGQGPVLMSRISQRQDISKKYLYSVLNNLKSAGLVQSVRGTGGGYVLARRPSEITLAEVLRALEGPFDLVECVTDSELCVRSSGCVARRVWQELSLAIEETLAKITLEDLVQRVHKAEKTMMETVEEVMTNELHG